MSKREHLAHDFELNLTPIIDCFVTLICFLLLSATYVNLVGMESKVPITVPANSEQAQEQNKKKDQQFKVSITVKHNGVALEAVNAGSASGKKFFAMLKQPAVQGLATLHDLPKLHDELVKIKNQRPKEFSIYFNCETDMRYEELVNFMDATRNLNPKDGSFTVTDERNGKTVKMDVLFPDFIVDNLTPTLASNTAKAGAAKK